MAGDSLRIARISRGGPESRALLEHRRDAGLPSYIGFAVREKTRRVQVPFLRVARDLDIPSELL